MAIIHITRHGPRWAGRGLAEGHQKGRVHRRNAECSALWATIRRTPVHFGQLGGHQCTVGNNQADTRALWWSGWPDKVTPELVLAGGCWWPVIGCERSRKVLPHITTWTPQLAAAPRNYSN